MSVRQKIVTEFRRLPGVFLYIFISDIIRLEAGNSFPFAGYSTSVVGLPEFYDGTLGGVDPTNVQVDDTYCAFPAYEPARYDRVYERSSFRAWRHRTPPGPAFWYEGSVALRCLPAPSVIALSGK